MAIIAPEPDAITAHERNADHVGDGLARVMSALRTKTRVAAVATTLLDEVQAAEDALWDLYVDDLDTAVGARLDQLGAVLGLPRGAASDDDYRAALRAIVRARRSNGTAVDLIAVAALLFGESPSSPPNPLAFTYTEGDASVSIEPHEVPAVAASVSLAVLRVAKAAGVNLQVFDPPAVESLLFAFSADPLRIDAPSAQGFSDTTQVNGGQLTGVVST